MSSGLARSKEATMQFQCLQKTSVATSRQNSQLRHTSTPARLEASFTCIRQRQNHPIICIGSKVSTSKLINPGSRQRTYSSILICNKMDSSLKSQPCNQGSTSIRRLCRGAMPSPNLPRRLSLSTTYTIRTLASCATIDHPMSFRFSMETYLSRLEPRRSKR